MYVLADGDHIYALNHDLKRLEQMQECDDPQYNEGFDRLQDQGGQATSESQDDRAHRRRHPGDLKEHEEARGGGGGADHLPDAEGDLEGILWEIVAAKYIPQISYQSGRICWLCLEVNDHKFFIKNQHPSRTTIDGTM